MKKDNSFPPTWHDMHDKNIKIIEIQLLFFKAHKELRVYEQDKRIFIFLFEVTDRAETLDRPFIQDVTDILNMRVIHINWHVIYTVENGTAVPLY